jgi:hypothetical protein
MPLMRAPLGGDEAGGELEVRLGLILGIASALRLGLMLRRLGLIVVGAEVAVGLTWLLFTSLCTLPV